MNTVPDTDQFVNPATLHKLGVLVPLRFHPLKLRPGRHALGVAGDGMRPLRSRAYIPGDDNPRDIDKFSPPGDRNVIEWEDEAQASVSLLVDFSGSMSSPMLAPLRNLCVMQLTYSLTRAGDRVSMAVFDEHLRTEVRAANPAQQLRQTAAMLRDRGTSRGATDLGTALEEFERRYARNPPHLLFIVSDFIGFDPARIRSMKTAYQRNVVPLVVTYEVPQSVRGAMKLADAEAPSRRLAWFGRGRVADVNREETQRVDGICRKFRASGLDCIVVRRQEDVYPQLLQLARFRRGRRL